MRKYKVFISGVQKELKVERGGEGFHPRRCSAVGIFRCIPL